MDAKNVLIGVGIFGLGLVTGFVVSRLLQPRPEAAKEGFLEGLLSALGKRAGEEIAMKGIRMGQVPAWQIPRERSPNYTVGGLWEPETERTIAKQADQLLLFL